MRIRARRVAVARFWGEVTLSVSLAIAAFVVWFVDRRDGEHHKAWGIPIFTWLIAGAVVLPILALVKLLVRVGTYLLEVVLCRVYENVQYVLISLRGGLTCAPAPAPTHLACDCLPLPCLMHVVASRLVVPELLCAHAGVGFTPRPHKPQRACACSVLLSTVALKGVVEYLVASAPGSPKGLPKALDQVTLCFVIFAFVELAKTLLARLLSLRLHSDALFDEIEVRAAAHPAAAACRVRKRRQRPPSVARAGLVQGGDGPRQAHGAHHGGRAARAVAADCGGAQHPRGQGGAVPARHLSALTARGQHRGPGVHRAHGQAHPAGTPLWHCRP